MVRCRTDGFASSMAYGLRERLAAFSLCGAVVWNVYKPRQRQAT